MSGTIYGLLKYDQMDVSSSSRSMAFRNYIKVHAKCFIPKCYKTFITVYIPPVLTKQIYNLDNDRYRAIVCLVVIIMTLLSHVKIAFYICSIKRVFHFI